jgi:hypothetical protein
MVNDERNSSFIGVGDDCSDDDKHVGAWWRLPEKLPAWPMLPYGQEGGRGSLPLSVSGALIRNGTRRRFCNVVNLVNRLETETHSSKQGRTADYLNRLDFIILDETWLSAIAQAGRQFLFHRISSPTSAPLRSSPAPGLPSATPASLVNASSLSVHPQAQSTRGSKLHAGTQIERDGPLGQNSGWLNAGTEHSFRLLQNVCITLRSIFVRLVLIAGDRPDHRQRPGPEFWWQAEYFLDKAPPFRRGEISDPLVCVGSDSHPLP